MSATEFEMNTDKLKSEKISFCATFKKHFESFAMVSPSTTPSGDAAKWELTTNWTQYFNRNTDFFAMVVKYVGKASIQRSVAFQFTFTLPNGLVVQSTKDIKTDFGVSRAVFNKCFHRSDFPYEDIITLQIDVFPAWVQDGIETPRKMLDLFNNQKHSDFVITVQEEKFPVHKCILANSSKVIEAMLLSGMSETETAQMEIKDFELETVRAMIKYMYDGIVERPTESLVLDLLRASDMYEVDHLHKWCHQYLLQHFSVPNALKILVAAYDFNAPELMEKCLEFIVENRKQINPKSVANKTILEQRKDVAYQVLLEIW